MCPKENSYLTSSLQGGFSPFDYVFFPMELFPKLIGGDDNLKIQKTTDLYKKSGYSIKQSFLVQLLKFAQYIIIVAVVYVIYGFISSIYLMQLNPNSNSKF